MSSFMDWFINFRGDNKDTYSFVMESVEEELYNVGGHILDYQIKQNKRQTDTDYIKDVENLMDSAQISKTNRIFLAVTPYVLPISWTRKNLLILKRNDSLKKNYFDGTVRERSFINARCC